MRLVRRFPQLEATLEDGRLNPTQLGILGHVLTPENVDEVVRAAAHLTKRKTEELAVSIMPKKVPAPGLRQLPGTRPAAGALEVQALPRTRCPEARPLEVASPPLVVAHLGVDAAQAAATRIAPVAKPEWQWRLRLDEARMAKLQRLKGMLAHAIPDGDLDRVFDQMLDDSLAAQGKKRGYVEPPRPRAPALPKPPTPGERARSRVRSGWRIARGEPAGESARAAGPLARAGCLTREREAFTGAP